MMDVILMVIGALTGVAALWFGGRRAGASAEKAKQTEARIEAVKQAQEVENEVEALDRDALKSRARVWVRGPKSR
jgi:hypothetical protein